MNSLKKNFIYNLVYQILVIILPLITSPYISRVLGVEGLGIYSYQYSVANYFLIFGMLGISNYGNRGVASLRENKAELNSFFSEVFSFQMFSMLVVSILYFAYLFIFCKANVLIASIMYIYLASGIFDINWLFFGLENFKITVTRNIIIKLASVACMFIFVHTSSHIARYSIIMSSGVFFSQLYLWKYVKKYVSFHFVKFKSILKHTKGIFILFISVLSYSIYKIMDKIMLGNLTSYIQVGLYTNAEKATNIPLGVISAFGTVMLPRMSNLMSTGEKETGMRYITLSIKFITFLACAISFGLIGISDVFTPVFFGPGYEGCSILIKLLSISVLFTSWATVVRTQYLIPNRKDKAYVISTIVGAVLNLLINLLLIPDISAVGAAIGTVVAEFSLMATQMFFVRKEIKFFKAICKETSYVACGIIMALIISKVGVFMGTSIFTLFTQIILGAFIYVNLSIIVMKIRKDEIYDIILDAVKVKLNKLKKCN